MGAWGPGVFENDHAMDLLSIETARWATTLRETLDSPDCAWDDIQGQLIYVRLLAVAAEESGSFGMLVDRSKPSGSSRDVATRWKARFLDLEREIPTNPARHAAVEAVFDRLIAAAANDDAPPPLKTKTKPKDKRKPR